MSQMPIRRSRAGLSIRVSFEFFPPKTPEAEGSLWQAIQRLAPFSPDFVSVTYGAGGSSTNRTHALVTRLAAETALQPAAHLTCAGASREEIVKIIRAYGSAGVRHIVALRGDSPGGIEAPYVPHPEGFQQTHDLIATIKDLGDFEVSVAAYPEKHPHSASVDHDIDVLKRKIDAGATRAITQFFFDNAVYYRYLDKVAAAGVTIPIVPGIVPAVNFQQTAHFAKRAGASVPLWFADRFEGLEDDAETRKLIAAAVCAEQVLDLIDHGITHFHFYTMNRADLVYAICHLIGLRAKSSG